MSCTVSHLGRCGLIRSFHLFSGLAIQVDHEKIGMRTWMPSWPQTQEAMHCIE